MTSVTDHRAKTVAGTTLAAHVPATMRSSRALAWTLRVFDVVMILAIYPATLWLRTGVISSDLLHSERLLVVVVVLMGTLYLFDTYRIDRNEARWRLASRVALAALSAGLLIGVLVYLVGPELLGPQYNVLGRTVLIPALALFAVCAIAVRGLARRRVDRLAGRTRWLVVAPGDSESPNHFHVAIARPCSLGELVVLAVTWPRSIWKM